MMMGTAKQQKFIRALAARANSKVEDVVKVALELQEPPTEDLSVREASLVIDFLQAYLAGRVDRLGRRIQTAEEERMLAAVGRMLDSTPGARERMRDTFGTAA